MAQFRRSAPTALLSGRDVARESRELTQIFPYGPGRLRQGSDVKERLWILTADRRGFFSCVSRDSRVIFRAPWLGPLSGPAGAFWPQIPEIG